MHDLTTPAQLGARNVVTVLPVGVSVEHAIDQSRWAALEFLSGTKASWGKRELAEWLAGAYHDAVMWAARSGDSLPPSGTRAVGGVELLDLLDAARESAIEMMLGCARSWCDVSFAEQFVEQGLIVRVVDAEGEVGYLPVDVPGRKLKDRVCSLVVADFLTRPSDYVGSVSVCEECQEVSFDWSPFHVRCSKAARESGIRLVSDWLDERKTG